MENLEKFTTLLAKLKTQLQTDLECFENSLERSTLKLKKNKFNFMLNETFDTNGILLTKTYVKLNLLAFQLRGCFFSM